VKRGELWTVSGGGFAGKPRPALVIQDDAWVGTSVTIIPLTSQLSDAPFWRITVPASPVSGLAVDSQMMIDKITTIKTQNVDHRIGQLSPAQMREVERLMLAFLGLAR